MRRPGRHGTGNRRTQAHPRGVVRSSRTAALGVLFSLAAWLCATVQPVPAGAAQCSNETIREEQVATYLPDCRAYERVSPLDKNGAGVEGTGGVTLSSSSGDEVTYGARAGFGETGGSGLFGLTQYVARREANGWASRGITPTPAPDTYQVLIGNAVGYFSESMDLAIVDGYDLPGATGGMPHAVNIYRENTLTGGLQTVTELLTSPPPFINPVGLIEAVRGRSGDLEVVALETGEDLIPEATGSAKKLYLWHNGSLTLGDVMPDGSIPAKGAEAAGNHEDNAVSRDGSRMLFVAPAKSGGAQIYMRKGGASTVWVSEAETTIPNPAPQGIAFAMSTPDEEHVVFLSPEPLVDEDPGGAGDGLYIYADGPEPETEANLTFVGRIELGRYNGSEVVSAISEDGSHLVFYTEANAEFAEAGTYMWEKGGVPRLIAATKAPIERDDIQIATDGNQLAFLATEQLTEDPLAPHPEGGKAGATVKAMYVYESASHDLRCASCMPAGTITESSATIEPEATSSLGTLSLPETHRFLTNDGRYVFFSTADALVPTDTNGLADAYEYDTYTGDVSLLTSGTGDEGSWFAGASDLGSNVFIVTGQDLVKADVDGLVDLYDVRVDGGFVEPNYAGTECAGDECQGTPAAPPSFDTANDFRGVGNLTPAKPHTRRAVRKTLRSKLRDCARKATKATRVLCRARVRRGAHRSLTRAQRNALVSARCAHARKTAARRRCRMRAKRKFGMGRGGRGTGSAVQLGTKPKPKLKPTALLRRGNDNRSGLPGVHGR